MTIVRTGETEKCSNKKQNFLSEYGLITWVSRLALRTIGLPLFVFGEDYGCPQQRGIALATIVAWYWRLLETFTVRNLPPVMALASLTAIFICGCNPSRHTHEDLDATLWMQTSAEYLASCRQAFRAATDQLPRALSDPTWSADLVQQAQLVTGHSNNESLPPAVIVDVDDTVLDNSPYQARLIQQDGSFDLESWHQWVEEASAEPVPGAKEFLRAASDAGVTVFFVTNRESAVEHATRRNLEALEMSEPDAPDRILSKRERDDWVSDKTSRRAHIAQRYRILLLVGDDLNDFVSVGDKPTAAERRELAAEHTDLWGEKWIVLPNADYGGWERSLYDWNDAAADTLKLQRKYDSLNDARDPADMEMTVDESQAPKD